MRHRTCPIHWQLHVAQQGRRREVAVDTVQVNCIVPPCSDYDDVVSQNSTWDIVLELILLRPPKKHVAAVRQPLCPGARDIALRNHGHQALSLPLWRQAGSTFNSRV